MDNSNAVIEKPIKPKKSKKKIVLEIIEWVIIALVIVFVAFVFIFASKSPTGNKQASLFGYQTLLVTSGSMEGSDEFYEGKNYTIGRLNTGTLIFIDAVPGETTTKEGEYTEDFNKYLENIKEGDVVTFIQASSTPLSYITHRVISKTSVTVGGHQKVQFVTQGDANNTADSPFYAENLAGKVIGNSDALGWLYTNVFSNKAIMAAVIITPCAIIIIYEVIKIIKIVKQDKKEKLETEKVLTTVNKDPEQEIAELEKKLAELKKKKDKKEDK